MVPTLGCGGLTGTALTKPAPPLQPGEPRCQGPPAPTVLNLAWDEPGKRGATISSYTVEMCLASDFLPAAPPPEEVSQPEPQETLSPAEEGTQTQSEPHTCLLACFSSCWDISGSQAQGAALCQKSGWFSGRFFDVLGLFTCYSLAALLPVLMGEMTRGLH